MEPYLISTDKLKKRGYIHENVEDSVLRTLIIRTQDRHVEPIIGTQLFKRLLTGIEDNDLTGDEITLMDDYIIPLMVAACDYRSVNVITYEIRNKAVGTSRDQYLQPVTGEEKADLKSDLLSDIRVYERRLSGFLQDNCDTYPLYKEYSCLKEDINPNKKQFISNISL